MEERKLISMVEYVKFLEYPRTIQEAESEMLLADNFYRKVPYYANFLKQPLTIGMFVPCGEDGKVLREPKAEDWSGKWHKEDLRYYWEEDDQYEFDAFAEKTKQYKQAQDRVIFEGFEVHKFDFDWEYYYFDIENGYSSYHVINGKVMEDLDHALLPFKTVEELVGHKLHLTQSKYSELFKK